MEAFVLHPIGIIHTPIVDVAGMPILPTAASMSGA
jgi:hypothetical protein